MARRDFLKHAGVAGLAGLVASCATAPAEKLLRAPASTSDFDYIVVGSGAGGGPVACRLAIAGFRVLLLEAGGRHAGNNYKVPVFHGKSTDDPNLSWEFFVKHYENPAEPDTKLTKDKDGIFYPRAATVGGCTAHNAMITLYPDNEDWNYIESVTHDKTWNAQNMRKYFERLENNNYLKLGKRPDNWTWNGFKGWLTTEQTSLSLLTRDTRLARMVFAAAKEEGLGNEGYQKLIRQQGNADLDPNNWQYVNRRKDGGLFNIPKATKNGARNGTREFIYDTMAKYPDNLILQTDCLVTNLTFDPNDDKLVAGVEYLEGAHLYRAHPQPVSPAVAAARPRRTATARKEVILSGGAFNSPQLLMLSGIGDPEQLARHDIPLRHPLRGVGRNLQDRYEVGVVTKVDGGFPLVKNYTFGAAGDPGLAEYAKDPKGSVYGSNGVVVALIKRSKDSKPEPDLVIFGVPGYFRGYYPQWSADATNSNYFTWAVLKGHTNNRGGTVELRSSDPLDTPLINFRYFEEGSPGWEDDLHGVLRGVQIARSINRRFMTVLKAKAQEVIPGSALESDDDVKRFVKREAWGHHASCTNKMGPATDPLAVVDSKFRVHGIRKLRIVDASVFPKIPGLFIVVPIYMIAEKAADDILSGRA